MTSNFNHACIARNLVRALALHNIESPDISVIENKSVSYFSATDLYFINKIHDGQSPNTDWHFVEEIDINSNTSKFYCAESFIEALGYVFEQVDKAGITARVDYNDSADEFEFIDAGSEIVQWSHSNENGELILYREILKKEVLFKVGEFATYDIPDASRKEFISALKGIRLYDNSGKLNARLKKIGGFNKIKVNHSNDVRNPSPALVTMIENFPGFMQSLLQDEFGIEVKLSKALEITAVTFGFKDWNTFKAMANKYRCSINNPFLIEMTSNEKIKLYFFDDVIDSLYFHKERLSRNKKQYLLNISLIDNFTLEIICGDTDLDKDDHGYMSSMSAMEDIPMRWPIPKCILAINKENAYEAEEQMNELFCHSKSPSEREEAVWDRTEERERLALQIELF